MAAECNRTNTPVFVRMGRENDYLRFLEQGFLEELDTLNGQNYSEEGDLQGAAEINDSGPTSLEQEVVQRAEELRNVRNDDSDIEQASMGEMDEFYYVRSDDEYDGERLWQNFLPDLDTVRRVMDSEERGFEEVGFLPFGVLCPARQVEREQFDEEYRVARSILLERAQSLEQQIVRDNIENDFIYDKDNNARQVEKQTFIPREMDEEARYIR